jgi:NAD(P)-dependent dehydrogenase (short-subunit alcohol dehydrogenase family)
MEKRICVLTGGCGGMGHAISLRLGKDHTMLLADISAERLDAEKAALSKLGIEAETLVVDVGDRAQVDALAERASGLGVVDTVLHAAGLSPAGAPAERIIEVNALGTVNMVEAFQGKIAEGGVMIVFGSSAAWTLDPPEDWYESYARWNDPDFFDVLLSIVGEKEEDADEDDEFFRAGQAYALTKRFVCEFARMNTVRFAERGVRILSFSPGSYLTPMHQLLIDNQPDMAEAQMELTPLGRWGRPVEVAGFIEFLCSPLAGYVTGVDILADGGTIAMQRVKQIG